MEETIRIWHERDSNGNHTGRTIAIIWKGDHRFVGVSECSEKDQFCKATGRYLALSRARGAMGTITPWDHFPQLFSCHKNEFRFNVSILGEFGDLPPHLYEDTRTEQQKADYGHN